MALCLAEDLSARGVTNVHRLPARVASTRDDRSRSCGYNSARTIELCSISRACVVEGRVKVDEAKPARTRLALFNDSALDPAGIGLKSTTRATISRSAATSQSGVGGTAGSL